MFQGMFESQQTFFTFAVLVGMADPKNISARSLCLHFWLVEVCSNHVKVIAKAAVFAKDSHVIRVLAWRDDDKECYIWHRMVKPWYLTVDTEITARRYTLSKCSLDFPTLPRYNPGIDLMNLCVDQGWSRGI